MKLILYSIILFGSLVHAEWKNLTAIEVSQKSADAEVLVTKVGAESKEKFLMLMTMGKSIHKISSDYLREDGPMTFSILNI